MWRTQAGRRGGRLAVVLLAVVCGCHRDGPRSQAAPAPPGPGPTAGCADVVGELERRRAQVPRDTPSVDAVGRWEQLRLVSVRAHVTADVYPECFTVEQHAAIEAEYRWRQAEWEAERDTVGSAAPPVSPPRPTP